MLLPLLAATQPPFLSVPRVDLTSLGSPRVDLAAPLRPPLFCSANCCVPALLARSLPCGPAVSPPPSLPHCLGRYVAASFGESLVVAWAPRCCRTATACYHTASLPLAPPPHTFLLLIFCAYHYAAQLIVAVLPRSPPRCFAALLHHCLVRRITGCSIAASLLQNCPAATASCHTASLRLSDPILSLAALLCPSTGCHLAASLPPFFCQIVALVV